MVLSRDMRDLLAEGGVPAERVRTIPNWIDTDLVQPVKETNRFRQLHDLDDKFVVMYSGNLGLSQNLAQVLEAAERLRGREQIVFVFVGDGADRPNLEQTAKEKGLTNVRFFDYQPKADLAVSLSAADVHLVVLQPHVRRLLMPSKVYGALASGTPVLAITTDDCELAEIVRRHDLGRVVSSGTAGELAEAIGAMAASPDSLSSQAANAREYAEAHCTRASSVEQMRSLCCDLLGLSDKRVAESVVSEPVHV